MKMRSLSSGVCINEKNKMQVPVNEKEYPVCKSIQKLKAFILWRA